MVLFDHDYYYDISSPLFPSFDLRKNNTYRHVYYAFRGLHFEKTILQFFKSSKQEIWVQCSSSFLDGQLLGMLRHVNKTFFLPCFFFKFDCATVILENVLRKTRSKFKGGYVSKKLIVVNLLPAVSCCKQISFLHKWNNVTKVANTTAGT